MFHAHGKPAGPVIGTAALARRLRVTASSHNLVTGGPGRGKPGCLVTTWPLDLLDYQRGRTARRPAGSTEASGDIGI